MKIFYLVLVNLLIFGTISNAQIQKIQFQSGDGKLLKINRISPSASHQANKISLNGDWTFSEDLAKSDCSKPIVVPGEWVMQGYEVPKDTYAGYQKMFTLPIGWNKKKLKLRFDALYSDAEIWLNGTKVGAHLGGFTPVEVDVTQFVQFDTSNLLLVKLKSDSKADSLASASTYAVHTLGGITRKVYITALEEINFAYTAVKTTFDKNYENANLSTDIIIANEADRKVKNLIVKAELFTYDGKQKISGKTLALPKEILKRQNLQENISFDVIKPLKWDTEHPNLYLLKLSILDGDEVKDVISKEIGFKQIEVRGNRVFVNNLPIKLRGVCHHETMPLRGRSVSEDMWKKDVELFREGNVNYIRTSHYPPAEELVDACNRLGMFLEIEAPFCWAENTKVAQGTESYQTLMEDQTLDMINFFRSNPSVLIWSLGNESGNYAQYFKETAKLVKSFDNTHPRNFSQYGPEADEGDLEITNHHYPGPSGPQTYRNYKRPIVFDEYVHLNAYNRLELVTDPGVRDAWGLGFEPMWENMYKTDAVLGGAIWAAIDDTFFLPNGKTVGYGTWGPIDGWRRMKPEYWHMKKIYSPVRIKLGGNWKGGKIPIELENRLIFSNLNECQIEWNIGKTHGRVLVDLLRNGKTTALIDVASMPKSSEKLTIRVFDPRKVLIDVYQFDVRPEVSEVKIGDKAVNNSWHYLDKGEDLQAESKQIKIKLNTTTGEIDAVNHKNNAIWKNAPKLMVLPLNGQGNGTQMTGDRQTFLPFTDVCRNHSVKSMKVTKTVNEFVVSLLDTYDEADGMITYTFLPNGLIKIKYSYTIKKEINPRQWGLVFNLDKAFQTLKWQRNAQWNYYPEDHIGRLSGMANLNSSVAISGPAGPPKLPKTPWKLDRNELGTNDFRSTKMNIISGQLLNPTSSFGIKSDGHQHLRAWKQGENVNLLVAGYSNLGNERFFRGHAEKMDKPMKPGDVIQDQIELQLK